MSENIDLQIISSKIIKSNSFTSLKLSPNDWIIPSSSTISCIYFYDIQQWSLFKQEVNEIFMNVERLTSSLQLLLKFYPLLNGTFNVFDTDNRVSLEYEENKGGILFVSTLVNIPLSDLPVTVDKYTDTKKIPESLQLINSFHPDHLLHIRHTRFSCGSVALGVSLNHQIADAHSYFQLIDHWRQLYRDENYQPDVCHQRSFLEPTDEEIQQLQTSNPGFDNRRSLAYNEEIPDTSLLTKQTVVKVFRFSHDELQRMKSNATAHLSSDIRYLSTFEVLTAHLFQHVMLARYHSASSTSLQSKLYISTNTRPRLVQPSIPTSYFGNAIMLSYSEMMLNDVLNVDSLSSIASRAHKSIEENTSYDIRTTLAWIVCQKDKAKIRPTWHSETTDFTISAWNKMGMYTGSEFESDVCACRIILPPDVKFNGAAILLSTEEDDGSIDVFLGLEVNEMDRLEKNSDFRRYSGKSNR
ncbi:unnamed protein product [Adineta ricciae]|uniref:Transferase n=1 Tax=Adineta ricciae TaxID=249248 RepID=A0A813Q2C5_ADIRI|nr:unnamed protein product [Adineta ricciae]